jgi:hypothetical protein
VLSGRPVTAPGSRARSREIGYAEAMADMSELLDDEASRWKNLAGKQLDPSAHAIASALSVRLDKLADYAHGASTIHEVPSLGEFLADTAWHPRYSDPAPAELPVQQSDN